MSCLQNFTIKEILNKHRERCLLINDTQAVRYETGEIKFKNYENQIPIPFKIYADTECLLKRINTDEGKCTNYIKSTFLILQEQSQFVLITSLLYQLLFFEGKNCINKFIKWIFRAQKYCNQIINNCFNKNDYR